MLHNADIPTRLVATMIVVALLFAASAMPVTSLASSPDTPAYTAILASSLHGTLIALAERGPGSVPVSAQSATTHAEPYLAGGVAGAIRRPPALRTAVAPRTGLTPLRI